jgi:hypothetical protein
MRAMDSSTKQLYLATVCFVEPKQQMEPQLLMQLHNNYYWIYKQQHLKFLVTLQLPRHKLLEMQSMLLQCAETVTESGCLDCLTVGFTNIQGCFPNTDGEAFDAGCFMRYSEKSFFADNQTIDITPFLKQGKIWMLSLLGLVLKIVCIAKIVFDFY